ncbi:MAG: hypothetical protein GEU93_07850 [Propionibacteriales bacterium]|nr:hypothetical protein [Propionibacteriales bacterium]
MAMYAMIAGVTYQDTGFFTPLYHIASLWAAPDSMMTSMEAGMAGDMFTFTFGPAVLGAVIHMMTGAMYGALFGVIAALTHVRGAVLVLGGLVWGAVVFAFSAWIGLPVAAAIFGSGDPISNMASMAGWGTFLTEHLIFGVVLGLLLLGRRVSR